MNNTKILDEIITTEETKPTVQSGKQLRRWMITINNPFWDETQTEIDITNTELPVVENAYDLSFMQEDYNQDLIDFKYIERKDKNNVQQIVKRPYFKNYESLKLYFENLRNNSDLKYAVYQYEQAETGTKHIQAFVIYKNGKRLKNVKQDFPIGHIEKAHAQSNSICRDYCMKKDTRISDPVEIGDFSEMRTRNDIKEFHEMLDMGASNRQLKDLFLPLYSSYGADKIERFRQDNLKDKYSTEFRDVKVTFIYGAERLGKTTYVYDKYPIKEICRVTNYKVGAFESYSSQNILLLDEFTGDHMALNFLNNILDKYPLELPARFTNRTACFTHVYIVSNLSLTDLYKNEQANTRQVYNAFVARIGEIIKFTALGKYKHEKTFDDTRETQLVLQTKLIELTPEELADMPF